MNVVKMKQLAFLFCIISIPVTSASANAEDVGVIGLLYDGDTALTKTDFEHNISSIDNLNCEVVRYGNIFQEQGNIDIDNPNKFFTMKCAKSIFQSSSGSSFIEKLREVVETTYLIEGDILPYEIDPSDSEMSKRAYIVKVSYFNNNTPLKRLDDLKTIRSETLKVKDRYKREMFIEGQRAFGLETPDEVALLYYDTPQHGERFRENNPKLMKLIGDFNSNHLNDHSYYFGNAEQ